MARVAKTKVEKVAPKNARSKKTVEAAVSAPKRGRKPKVEEKVVKPVKGTKAKTIRVKKPIAAIAAAKKFVPKFNLNFSSIKKPSLSTVAKYRPTPKIVVALIVGALFIVAAYNKSWFIAATIDGKPITNFELMSRMNQQYRDQVLNQMINEKILTNEAEKKSIIVASKEIDDREKQMVGNVGGKQAFESLLAQQGQTESSFRNQLQVWMTIEKLYSKEATVSSEEINKFIEQNKDQMQSTDSAKQAKEAEDALKQQKLGQLFNQKFQELKQTAKVSIF